MVQELKITPPEGYEIDKEKSTFENIVFKEIKNSIDWVDFGYLNGYYVDGDSNLEEHTGDPRNHNRNTWPTIEEAEACLALSQLCQWRDKYNEGWRADWSDGISKYTLVYKDDKIFYEGKYAISKVLSFKSEKIAERFLKDFRELIEIAKPLL